MSFRIVADSSCEWDYTHFSNFYSIPFILRVNDVEYIDDNREQMSEYIDAINNCLDGSKSACPSPQAFLDCFGDGTDDVFVVTLSGALSGSYQSACIARDMFLEEHPNTLIHVFDSASASAGETVVARYIADTYNRNNGKDDFERYCKEVQNLIDKRRTFFFTEDLTVWKNNGRVNSIEYLGNKLLKLKPIMADKNGKVINIGITRSVKDAVSKIVSAICDAIATSNYNLISISHCFAEQGVTLLENALMEKGLTNIQILPVAKLSGMYINKKGFIISYI